MEVGWRVVEDYDVGDREPRVGTVERIKMGRTPVHQREGPDAYVRWDEDAWPKCTLVPVDDLRRIGGGEKV